MSTRLRASSLPDLLDCPARWEAKHVLGMTKPFSSRAALGQCVHDATAFYDVQTHLLGLDADQNLALAQDRFLQKFAERRSEWMADRGNDLPFSTAEKRGKELVTLYALNISSKFRYVAVELTFRDVEVQVGDVSIRLTGTADRIYSGADGLGLLDLKSGKNRVTQEGVVSVSADKPQLGVYELLAEQHLGEFLSGPAYIAGLDTEKSVAAVSDPIPGAKELVVGTEDEPGILHAAALYLQSGIFPPNPKSQLCSPAYCTRYERCKAHS